MVFFALLKAPKKERMEDVESSKSKATSRKTRSFEEKRDFSLENSGVGGISLLI